MHLILWRAWGSDLRKLWIHGQTDFSLLAFIYITNSDRLHVTSLSIFYCKFTGKQTSCNLRFCVLLYKAISTLWLSPSFMHSIYLPYGKSIIWDNFSLLLWEFVCTCALQLTSYWLEFIHLCISTSSRLSLNLISWGNKVLHPMSACRDCIFSEYHLSTICLFHTKINGCGGSIDSWRGKGGVDWV